MFVVRNVRGPAPGAGTTTVRSRVAVTRTRAPDAVGMTLAIEMSENLSSPDSETVLQLRSRRTGCRLAPEREVAGGVLRLLRGEIPLDRGAQHRIVNGLTAGDGRQGRDEQQRQQGRSGSNCLTSRARMVL